MTTAATSLLGLALPVTGELSGTWGDTVNNSITSLLDSAVAGTTTISTDGDVTLTTTTLAANQARQAVLLFSGARTALRTVTAPAQSKIYTVINATTGGYAVKLVGVGPTTGLTIPNGASAVVAWNGSDFIEIGTSSIGNLTVNGNLTVTGTTTLSAGTANGVGYLNGSKVLTTGSALTFDGTVFGLSGASPEFKLGRASGSQPKLSFGPAASTDFYVQADSATGIIRYDAGPSAAWGGKQAWFIDQSEAMRLTSTGLGIGTSSPSAKLHVVGSMRQQNVTDGNETFKFVNSAGSTLADLYGYGTSYFTIQSGSNIPLIYNSTGASGYHRWQVNSNDVARIDSSGNLIQSAPTTPPSLSTNGTMVFNLTSNTNLRVSVRGADGVTRTANITLA